MWLHIDGNAPATTMNLSSQLRHFLTFLAGTGTALASWAIIAPDQVAAVNAAGGELIGPLVIILGAIAAGLLRLAMGWMTKQFSDKGKTSGGTSGGKVITALLVCTMAVVMGSLPSCASYPVTATGWFKDPATGAKAVLSYSPDHKLQGGITVPVYDAQTGELLGMTDVKFGGAVTATM